MNMINNRLIKPGNRAYFYGKALGLLLVIGFVFYGLAKLAYPIAEKVRYGLDKYRQSAMEISAINIEIQGLREDIRRAIEYQDKHMRLLEEELKQMRGEKAMAAPSPALSLENRVPSQADKQQPAPSAIPSQTIKPPGGITVCYRGCEYQDLQKAVDAAPAGGVVSVSPEINGTCAVISKPLRIVGLRGKDGKRAHLAGGVCAGKAPLVTAAANIVIEGFEISGVSVADGTGACIRLDQGTRDLIIRNIYCHDSQDGLLGRFDGSLLVEDSILERNGFSNGQSHGVYLLSGKEAVIRRSQIISTKNAGHSIKSGVEKLLIEDSLIAALNAPNSRALDLFAGGDIVLRRNVIQQGPQSDNSDVIGLALEPQRLLPGGHSFLMEENWVIFDNTSHGNRVLFRGKKLGPVGVHNNAFVSLTKMGLDGVDEYGNRWFETREQAGLPRYDGSLDSLPKPGKGT